MLNRSNFTRRPWNQTGCVIDIANSQNCYEALKEIGGDFNIEKRQAFYDFDNNVNYRPIPRTFVNVRTDTNQVVGVVGDRYNILQNRFIAEWFQPWIDSGAVVFNSGGVLDNGGKIWMLAEIQRPPIEVVKDDKISKFLIFSNSHDGTGSIKVGFMAVRLWCTNMLASLHSRKANSMIRIRHGSNAISTLNDIQKILSQADKDFEEQIEDFKLLASKKLKTGDLELYVKTLLGEEKTPTSELSTRKLNILRDIVGRCIHGAGQQNDGVAGTYWAAYNGYNEYLNYAAGNNENNRLNSLFNETDNVKALRLAYNMASAA